MISITVDMPVDGRGVDVWDDADDRRQFEHAARFLASWARHRGFVLTVKQVHASPLAMGAHFDHISVTPAREGSVYARASE